jgi:hypothetical protein
LIVSRPSGRVWQTAGIVEGSKKAVRIVRSLECDAEDDLAAHNAHHLQIGRLNAGAVKPTAYFSEVISDREITGPRDLDASLYRARIHQTTASTKATVIRSRAIPLIQPIMRQWVHPIRKDR